MHSMDQRSEEWFACRLGKATASKIADVMARTKTGYSTSRANYAAQLVVERLTGRPTEGFTNAAMQHGIDHEAAAREAYERHAFCTVAEIGFVDHPRIAWAGASPDGLIGDVGLCEIKCPTQATHLDTLLGAPIADKYLKQMQWQIACTNRDWCDFVSYDPRFPEEMQLHVRRVERDNELIEEMEREVETFLAEVAERVERLQSTYMMKEAA